MFKQITIKTKLLIPMFMLTVVLLFLGGMVIFYSYGKMQLFEELNEKMIFSRHIAAALHTLQKERGLSSGYLESKNNRFQLELNQQRKQTDIKVGYLLRSRELPKQIIQQLNKIQNIRKNIDTKNITSTQNIVFYSNINEMLLNEIVKISQISHIPQITKRILSYINFLYLKEYGGIERAKGMVILSSNKLTIDQLIEFTNIISMQYQHQNMFLKYVCKNFKKLYLNQRNSKSFKTVENMQNIIIHDYNKNINIDSKNWFEAITMKLDKLENIGKIIEDDIKLHINLELQNVRFIFNLVVFLTILSLIMFVFIIIAFLRLANEEQRLRMVTQKYIISSVTDLKGRIIDASDAFCNISGYSKEELIGQPHNIVRHPDMPKEAFKELWNTIQQGKAWKGKVKNLKKDGGFYWVWANIEPLYNDKGHVDSYISVRLDITENELLMEKIKEEERKNKVAQEMMYQQSRLAQMGEMLSMIAHQWRQPLTAIAATSGAINIKAKLKKLDDSTAIELTSKIQDISKHLSQTIDDFRGFFKTNKTKNVTNLKIIAQDVINIANSSLHNDNSIDLILDVKSYVEFSTYDSELKQVVLNLIKNAEDALKEKNISDPTIVIEISDFVLRVYDNAGGIDDTILEKIFDPYFTTKEKKDGTGLGLYMSKTIVEDHCGGKLQVKNGIFVYKDKELNGAQFTIELPDENKLD